VHATISARDLSPLWLVTKASGIYEALDTPQPYGNPHQYEPLVIQTRQSRRPRYDTQRLSRVSPQSVFLMCRSARGSESSASVHDLESKAYDICTFALTLCPPHQTHPPTQHSTTPYLMAPSSRPHHPTRRHEGPVLVPQHTRTDKRRTSSASETRCSQPEFGH